MPEISEKTSSGKLLKVEIVTPKHLVASDEAQMVVAPGEMGSFGIMYNHIPFLSALKTGEVRLVNGDQKKLFAMSQGFLEMSGNKVVILADGAEQAEEIDVARAQAAKERAIKRLGQAETDASIDDDRAKRALLRALNRLKIAEKVNSP